MLGQIGPHLPKVQLALNSTTHHFRFTFNIETSPNYVFVRHEIRGGTSGSLGYLVYTQAPISIGQIYLFL